MLVPNRHGTSIPDGHRYGFNGKENDNEIMGEGNFEDYGMRMYNPRVGRFFNADPIIIKNHRYPDLSTYQFASNTPIQSVDLDGLEGVVYVNIIHEPTAFNRVLYSSQLKKKLIENGAHPQTEIKFVDELSWLESIKHYFKDKKQDIDVQIRNYDRLSKDRPEAGGYSNQNVKGIVNVYRGLTTDPDFIDNEIPVEYYVNASLHEIGHNLFNLMHDENGNTPDGIGLMDYDHAYEIGANFSPDQQKIIYKTIGFGNKENPQPSTKKEQETQKKQLSAQKVNDKPKKAPKKNDVKQKKK